MGPSKVHPQSGLSLPYPTTFPFMYNRRADWRLSQAHRKALLDVMTSFVPIDTVKFNKRLTNIQQLPDKVVVTFADGEVVEASALVGADGIQSTVREHVLEDSHPDQVEPVYADAYCYRGVIPMEEAKEILGDFTDVAKFCFGDRRSAITYRISGGAVSQLATLWVCFTMIRECADRGLGC